ncbi:hypothetical protein [Streptomyces ardesiacus]|uniref:hypothetical protein n=1 Tax=Streptomyces ardesiacus TaxID=285564 RepID=UPI002FDBF8EB
MSNVINLDLGKDSTFLGYPTEIAGETVCVLSSRAATDSAFQGRVRRFMKAEGRDCGTCRACPVGQAL